MRLNLISEEKSVSAGSLFHILITLGAVDLAHSVSFLDVIKDDNTRL